MVNIYFTEASALWEIALLFLEVTGTYHLWAHNEVFSMAMRWSLASSLPWAEPSIPARLWEVPLYLSCPLSWWCLLLVPEACHDSMAALRSIWCADVTAPPSFGSHPVLESWCTGSTLATSSPHILQIDMDPSDCIAHSFLFWGLEKSVHGDCSIGQIWVKDNILSLVLLFPFSASFAFS